MDKFEFEAGTEKLIVSLEQDDGCWCELFVDGVDFHVRIGYDLFEIVRNRLKEKLLTADGHETFTHEGKDVFSVINFSGPHTTLFASPQAGGVELYLQEQHRGFRRLMWLSSDDIDRLTSMLDRIA